MNNGSFKVGLYGWERLVYSWGLSLGCFCIFYKINIENIKILLYARLLCRRNSPDKNTGVGAMPLARGSSQPRDQTHISHIAGRFFNI